MEDIKQKNNNSVLKGLLIVGIFFFLLYKLLEPEITLTPTVIGATFISIPIIILGLEYLSSDRKSPEESKRKKNSVCQKCNIELLNNTDKFGFDVSYSPERGDHKTLCKNCIIQEWKRYIKDTPSIKFLSTLPIKGYNSYSFITLADSHLWGIEKKDIVRLQNLLSNISPKCEKCSSKPITRLIIDKDYYSRLTNSEYEPPVQDLCLEHFINFMFSEFEENRTRLDEINIPYKKDGIYMSGEY